jgi:hypothetical protein
MGVEAKNLFHILEISMIRAFEQVLLAVLFCISTVSLAQEERIAEAVVEPADASKLESPKPTARAITVSVSLVDDNTIITGTLTETNSFSIKTAFGVAELPLSEVAGVRFPRNDDTSTTVVMLNGDSITGATDVKFATVETTWGSAKINGQSIASMLMVPGLTWQSTDVLGTKRWQLIEAPRNQPPTGGVQPARPGVPLPLGAPRTTAQPAIGQPAGQPIRINN